MTLAYRILLRATLGCVLCTSPIGVQAGAKAPEVREIVNLFPVQSWAVLGAASAPVVHEAMPELPPPPPPPPPPPFELVGQWADETGRVIVLEGAGQTYLLCEASCSARDAIVPGQRIAPGYRFKAIKKQALTIVADDGKVLELPLMDLKS